MAFSIVKKHDIHVDLKPYQDARINATLAWHASTAAVTTLADAFIDVSGSPTGFPSIPATLDGVEHPAYIDFIGVVVNEVSFAIARFTVETADSETIYFIVIHYSNIDGWVVDNNVIMDTNGNHDGQEFGDLTVFDQLRFFHQQ